MTHKQITLDGKTLEWEEDTIERVYKQYTASYFGVRISEEAQEKLDKLDPTKRRTWLVKHMRLMGDNEPPKGFFEKDFEILYQAVF